MTGKRKLDEQQIWTMVMTVLPVVMLMNARNELTNDSGIRVLYAGVFGGVGGLIGFTINYLTKDKSRLIKILASLSILIICGLTIYFLSSKPTDKEILNQEWETQKIGKIEFDYPTKLKLQSSEIPESVNWFYSELKLYSDGGNDRIASFLKTKILVDTLSIENAYSYQLEGMLKKMQVDIENVELEVFLADEEEISSMFSYDLNGKQVNGYGFMYMYENSLESIWLMPIIQGFSKDFIEEFEAGIIPEYE